MNKPRSVLSIIDIGISNIGSVVRAFQRLGIQPELVADATAVESAHAIVLPGVGAFGDGMAALREKGLVEPLREAARAGKPILGLCLGMQLLADSSEEYGSHTGLGIIPGAVVKLKPGVGERVPNIGWCDVLPHDGTRLFHDFAAGTPLYFVHGYHMICANPGHVAATMSFGGGQATVAVEHGNVFGIQCHPEKSQDAGLGILDAFVSIATESAAS
ncbi:imidazole glycerol phosphate synthase subunit HisH [Sulfuritalea sp.]|uniref:imidazole glycerol phosphate synthase subunit HisH n=1 Tax=Sulfuritalea sp. TaxID=2480090 RepID=UPI00286D7F4C|nr:imidazole glycerol phosphate synthase subunit HisH [Sulfuritalea sp.]